MVASLGAAQSRDDTALSLRFSLEQEVKQDALEQRDKREMAMPHEVQLILPSPLTSIKENL